MSIDETQLKIRIRDIIGDQQGQFDAIITLELQQAVLNVTRNYTFYWNTIHTSNLSHTDGVITLPSETSKILHLSDSAGNLGYVSPSADKFYIHRGAIITGKTNNKQFTDNEHAFIITRAADGTESILLDDPSTDPTRTFNLTYTKYYTTVDPVLPDTMYMYLLGETVFNLMNDTEDADLNLINRYKLMADRSLKQELRFSDSRDVVTLNQPATPTGFQTRSFSNGV